MIVACGEWGLRELRMEDHFQLCKRFGFHYLEIGLGGDVPGRLPEEMSDREISEFISLREKYDIKTPVCVLVNDFTFHDAAAHQKMVDATINQLYPAKKLGAKLVRLFAGFTPANELTEAIWQRLLSALRQCDQVCRELELAITLETHGQVIISDNIYHHVHTVSTDLACLKRLVKEIPEAIGFCYDPGNMRAVEPEDERYGLDLINNRINYCHLKDWRPKGDGWYPAAPGDDGLDYAQLLPKMKYNGIFTIEYEPPEDVEDGFQRGLDYLKSICPPIEFQ